MSSDQNTWNVWAVYLRRWGLLEWVISTLQLAGPLAFLGSQLIYVGAPMLRNFGLQNQLLALARVLEEPTQMKIFTSYLSEMRQEDV